MTTTTGQPLLRPHAEQVYAAELAALAAADDRPRPPSWRMSPQAVVTYLLGGTLPDGTVDHAQVHRAAAADRGGRGHPGHRPGAAAARPARHGQDVGVRASGRRHLRRLRRCWSRAPRAPPRRPSGTAGTTRGCWPRGRAGPRWCPRRCMTAMAEGRIARVEELTRIPSDVQDALITILSEKTLPVPGAGHRGPGGQGLLGHRHGQRPGPGRQRAVLGAAPPVQHGGAAAARQRGRGGGHRGAPGGASSARRWNCPRCRPRWRRSAGW